MSAGPNIQVIVLHWKRPQNLVTVLNAFRQQTIEHRLILADNHPSDEFAPPADALDMCDDVFRWKTDYGPFGRLVPALLGETEWTYFHDDDAVPGRRCLEYYLESAREIGDFATLGQQGRFCRTARGRIRYSRRKIRPAVEPRPVDLCVQSHFLRTENLPFALEFRHALWRRFGSDVPAIHDDIMLCCGVQKATSHCSYLTRSFEDAENAYKQKPLRSPFAVAGRPGHYRDRSIMFRMAWEIGWRPQWREAAVAAAESK